MRTEKEIQERLRKNNRDLSKLNGMYIRREISPEEYENSRKILSTIIIQLEWVLGQ